MLENETHRHFDSQPILQRALNLSAQIEEIYFNKPGNQSTKPGKATKIIKPNVSTMAKGIAPRITNIHKRNRGG
jgi:hypothetical protein